MTVSVALLIIWGLAGLIILSGSVGRGGWLMLAVAGLHVAYGSYLISTG
tara:strand:- start:743 stop:889 length:147 start_codon:yes stop_codon:yes gene_type:complete